MKRKFRSTCQKGAALVKRGIPIYSMVATSDDHTVDALQGPYPYVEMASTGPILRYRSKLNFLITLGLFFILLTTFTTMYKPFQGSNSPKCRPVMMAPSYALIKGFDKEFHRLAQKYHLYLYREQGRDKGPSIDNEIHLDGIPVLFIPGNAGSFKQMRSLAASAANLYYGESRSSIVNDDAKNLDFFGADFNEDYTAFHGRTMLDQAEYCNAAIDYILELYKRSSAYKKSGEPLPQSVIVVGHSMGGVVARVMTTLKNHIPESINTIFTLSSPHSTAPATFDGDILKIYEQLNSFWRNKFNTGDYFYVNNMSVVSITGGILDSILPADYTSISSIIPEQNGFTTYSTTIPGVWTPVDHLAIVWCDQLRTVLAKLLIEMVDSKSASKTHPLAKRMELARRYLLSGLEDSYEQGFNAWGPLIAENVKPIQIDNFKEIEMNVPLTINKSNHDAISEYSVFKIHESTGNKTFSILTSFSNTEVFFCKTVKLQNDITYQIGNRMYNCTSMSEYMISVPRSFKGSLYPTESSVGSGNNPFKLLHTNDTILSSYNLVVVQKPPLNDIRESDFIVAELSTRKSVETFNKNLFQLLFSPLKINHVASDFSFIFAIRFPRMTSSLVSYVMSIEYDNKNLVFEPLLSQSVAKTFETKWHLDLQHPVDISFYSDAPFIPSLATSDKSLRITLLVPPLTDLKIRLRINWFMTLKLLFTRYRLAILTLPTVLISLVLCCQFFIYNKSGDFMSFDLALHFLVRKYWGYLMTVSIFLTPLMNVSMVQKLLLLLDPIRYSHQLQLSNKQIISSIYYLGVNEVFMCWLGPMLLTMSLTLVYLLYALIAVVDFVLNKGYNKIIQRSLRDGVKKFLMVDDEINKKFEIRHYIGFIIVTFSVLFYIPYQVAYVLLTLLQVTTCIRLSQIDRGLKKYANLKNYNLSLLLLLLLVLPVNIPVVVVFLHNLAVDWETPFTSHHNFLAILPLIFLIAANTSFRMPARYKANSRGLITVGGLLYLSIFTLIYGIRTLYWVHHLVNAFAGWLFLISLDNISPSDR
ncbi:Bst1p Ecym_1465 [Eremothecium cymbalariae DBVPG|uniref:GPI inositol-deacylase n=1 Tax=Eremothecium cymbalariae (strain CBS 270.75 / DBVPG 7215 / KCTC 17166 / NRRL Y-17582) TaxID=931890 RepID=G8JMH4_ERECY|nr:hypothetical protein Ecym_1465 [Eremothecium cymbalariae DBVPG\